MRPWTFNSSKFGLCDDARIDMMCFSGTACVVCVCVCVCARARMCVVCACVCICGGQAKRLNQATKPTGEQMREERR